jgi:hypothetical protein
MTDAIQQDAPQEAIAAQIETQSDAQQEQTEERQLSAREQAMADMAARRREQIAEETGAPPEPVVTAPEAPDMEAQIAAQTAPTVLSDHFDQVRVRAKIDGEEIEVPLDQVMRQYQKHSTADRRLAEATRLLREAEARTAQPTQQEPAAAPAQPPSTKEFLSALFTGDEDTAAQALDQLMQGRQPHAPIPDASAIARQVKQQIEVESALSSFAEHYADVCADPYLADMADRILEQNLQAGEPFAEAIKAAGDGVRGWLQSKTGAAPATPVSTTRTERLDRKAALDTVRTANVTAASPTQQPRSEEQIRADALAQLIKSRPGMAA